MCCLHQEQKECIVSRLASPAARGHGIWEADELFKCPLVGIGLTFTEQKRLLNTMSLPPVEPTPFELHELCVNAASTENPLSRKVSQLLRRKYEREAAPLRELDEETFLARWKTAFADGQYAAFGKITDNAQAAVDISRVNRDMFTDKPKKPQTIKSIRVDTQGVEYPTPEKH